MLLPQRRLLEENGRIVRERSLRHAPARKLPGVDPELLCLRGSRRDGSGVGAAEHLGCEIRHLDARIFKCAHMAAHDAAAEKRVERRVGGGARCLGDVGCKLKGGIVPASAVHEQRAKDYDRVRRQLRYAMKKLLLRKTDQERGLEARLIRGGLTAIHILPGAIDV